MNTTVKIEFAQSKYSNTKLGEWLICTEVSAGM